MTTSSNSLPQALTQRQSEVLQVIRNHIESTGAPPTRAEIAKTLGFRSVNAAEDHLKALARKGAITLAPGTSRGIQLSGTHGLGLPIITQAEPDKPLLNEANIEKRFRIQPDYFAHKPDFLFRVQGPSFAQGGIFDGDLVAVCSTLEPKHGQLVIARHDNKLLLRRYFENGDKIELQADNNDFSQIVVNRFDESLKIEGVCTGVIRTEL